MFKVDTCSTDEGVREWRALGPPTGHCVTSTIGDTRRPPFFKEVLIHTPPDAVWDAVRDVAVRTRVESDLLTGCGMEEAPLARVVSFANGMEAHELVVDVDEAARRFVWSVGGGRLTQHNASMQIVAEGLSHPRVVWIADLLPNDLAGVIAGMIEQGLAAMQKTLEC